MIYHVLQFSWRRLTCFGRKWDDAVPFKKITTGSFALLKWWRINFWGLCHAGCVRRPVIASCGSRFFLGNSAVCTLLQISSIMWKIYSRHFHFPVHIWWFHSDPLKNSSLNRWRCRCDTERIEVINHATYYYYFELHLEQCVY